MKVLSLFDGISCGMVALERAGIPVERYVAYEIEPNAIKISQKNHPQIEHCGDVTTADFTQYEGFELLIGGSPCQDLSNYKYGTTGVQGLEGEKSNLFYHFVRALKECKPKYFLLENVASMEQKWSDVITMELGVNPLEINSSLVCAAERKRLYWTNIPIARHPQDKGIVLKDIAVDASEVPQKYWYDKPFTYNGDDKKVQCTLHINGHRNMKEVYNLNGKCNTILCDGDGGNRQKKIYQDGRCRKLMPIEYERLQTLPDNYTEGVADSRRYTAIGNAWTVDVIAHIFTGLKNESEKKEMQLKMNEYQLPEIISFNYSELKQELSEKVQMYTTLVYTDDQITEAKKDRASLNRLKKALNDERIRLEKEYLEPFNKFKAQINEIIQIIDEPIAVIDKQVKEAEEAKKQDKLAAIKGYFTSCQKPFDIPFEKILDQKWLNASVSLKSVYGAIDVLLESITKDLSTLENLPEFAFEAVEEYKTTLDLQKSLYAANRAAEMAKRKAEAEARKHETEFSKHMNPPEEQLPGQIAFNDSETFEKVVQEAKPERTWLGFKAFLTVADAQALANLFAVRGIEYERIKID